MAPPAKTAAKKKPAPKKKSTAGREPEKREDVGDTASLSLTGSQYLVSWLAGQGVSLAFTSAQTSKLFLVGPTAEGELSVAERTIPRCKGLVAHGRSLYVSADWQIWRFENALNAGERSDGFDAVYVPKASHVTGDIDCPEMAVDGDGRLVFVNTRFNCLAYLSRDYSFHPVWKPDFVSAYVPEDRCHLTGLALHEGRPAFATATARSDKDGGWKQSLKDGGVVVHVMSGEVICDGLSMPRAPRMHGRTLWLQEAGTGYLGRVNKDDGKFEPVVRCPGFLSGMTIVGNFAVACVSRMPEGEEYADLDLQMNLQQNDAEPTCGLLVIELTSGNIIHWLRLDGMISDISGVTALPGVFQPRAVGFKTDEIARTISLPPEL
ncbi:MAG: TIGR03032 family protein [Rhodospirillales bacterium]